MRIDNFEMKICGGIADESSDGYVKMQHGQTYKVVLVNTGNRDSDVELNIDGKNTGSFRLNKWSSVTIERPVNDNGKFTFYKDGTVESRHAGIDGVAKRNRGLVQAIFKPEKYKETYTYDNTVPISCPDVFDYDTPKWLGSLDGLTATYNNSTIKGLARGPSGQSVSSGGTGLSGKSNQSFYTVSDLDVDPNEFITINLRLVCNESIRPLISAKVRSNPIPSPV